MCATCCASVSNPWRLQPLLLTNLALATEIIVVDNASSDGSVEMVRAEFPQVRLIVNATNRGYTGGNNDGIAAADRALRADPQPRHASAG